MDALSLKPERVNKEDPARLRALEELFSALNSEGVRYCHWKSNVRLNESLQGKTDLDLLVDPEHKEVFERMLREWNILLFLPAPGRSYPGIENHLGYDPESGKLFHLHVHYRLVLGEQFVKNYDLPLEEIFLNSVQLRHGVKTPIPELEIIVLSLRALLKYRDRDGVKDILGIRSPGLPHHIRKEIEWLSGQTTLDRIAQMLETAPAIVPTGLVLEFLETVARNPRAGYHLLQLRQKVRRALRGYQRQDRAAAMQRYFREVWRRRSFLNGAGAKRMTLSKGGVRIAFIGADGAGKSTLIKELTRWLSWRVDVRTYYMGSSQPFRLTRMVKGLSKFTHRACAGAQRYLGNRNPITRLAGSLSRLFAELRYMSEARDRYIRYKMSCQAVERGALVFYDRYPLDNVRIFNRPVDGPRIAAGSELRMGWITRALSRAEQDLYQRIQPPDHVVMMNVRPDVSQARKPEHKWDLILAKSQALQGASRNGYDLTKVDANQPLEEVTSQVKPVIWRLLE